MQKPSPAAGAVAVTAVPAAGGADALSVERAAGGADASTVGGVCRFACGTREHDQKGTRGGLGAEVEHGHDRVDVRRHTSGAGESSSAERLVCRGGGRGGGRCAMVPRQRPRPVHRGAKSSPCPHSVPKGCPWAACAGATRPTRASRQRGAHLASLLLLHHCRALRRRLVIWHAAIARARCRAHGGR